MSNKKRISKRIGEIKRKSKFRYRQKVSCKIGIDLKALEIAIEKAKQAFNQLALAYGS